MGPGSVGPALSAKDFAADRRDLAVGASIQVTVPVWGAVRAIRYRGGRTARGPEDSIVHLQVGSARSRASWDEGPIDRSMAGDYRACITGVQRESRNRTMSQINRISLGLLAMTLCGTVFAGKPVIYPAKGQSASQQQRDEGECNTWAKGNTGVDPVAVAAASPPSAPAPAPAPGGQRIAGAATGAIVGGLVTGGDDSGAKAGAAVGVIAGGAKARQQHRTQQQAQAQAQQQQAQAQQKLDTFYKAFGACMEGRGYTVK